MSKPVAILNTSICTTDGLYELQTITLEEVKNFISSREILSAVGHESTAQILTELLGQNVPVNRIEFKQEENQTAIVFKLNGRPPEGKILTREDIDQIGYTFKRLFRATSAPDLHLIED
jgi:hypothetical protein